MTLRPWWERFPEVLRQEEADLKRLGGRPAVLNEALLREAAVRQYEVSYVHKGQAYPLTVTYADLHPYFRVEVTSSHHFTTHQQPFYGNLCLSRGGTWSWNVDETAAQFIESQMPLLLADAAAGADATDDGVEGATVDPEHVEPFVGYYTYTSRTAIRIDGSWPDLTESRTGTFTLGLDQPPDPKTLRGTVLDIRDADDNVVREADAAIPTRFPMRATGRWCRLDHRPSQDDPAAVLEAAINELPELSVPRRNGVGAFELDVLGVVFSDGIKPGLHGDAWMFVVRAVGPQPLTDARSKTRGRPRGRVTPSRERIGPYLARAFRSGRRDLAERVPSVSPLAKKKIVVVGAGAVGGPSIIELAKAGTGKLAVVEFDVIDPGTAPRWVLGYQFGGLHKLEGINHLVATNWPYTSLELCHLRLGSARLEVGLRPEWDVLRGLLDGADLLYDATAEIGVSYYLSELAKELGVPFIVASGSEGGWGGRVARFRPGIEDPCWTCLMHHELDNPAMIPPADPEPATRQVWPAGCTDPTFTGTGFDVATVSLAGVRAAASTLCEGSPGAYPPIDWDVAVYQFRDQVKAFAGSATTHVLAQHPDCEPCRIRRSG